MYCASSLQVVARWQLSTKFLEVVCDEHGIGGRGEYCGKNDAQLDRISVFYHVASDGKYRVDSLQTRSAAWVPTLGY